MNDKTTSMFRLFKTVCVHSLALVVLPATAVMYAEDDGDDDNRVLIQAIVPASLGGTLSDDPDDPQITVSIPAGALNVDARLRVVLLADRDDEDDDEDDESYSDPNQTPASPVYNVRLTKKRGRGHERLTKPMALATAAAPAPVHPQLGEIAFRKRHQWQRLDANFSEPRIRPCLRRRNGPAASTGSRTLACRVLAVRPWTVGAMC